MAIIIINPQFLSKEHRQLVEAVALAARRQPKTMETLGYAAKRPHSRP